MITTLSAENRTTSSKNHFLQLPYSDELNNEKTRCITVQQRLIKTNYFFRLFIYSTKQTSHYSDRKRAKMKLRNHTGGLQLQSFTGENARPMAHVSQQFSGY